VIVQHRGKTNKEALADFLAQAAPFPVVEPDDKEPLESGHVYLAPGQRSRSGGHVLDREGRRNPCRTAVAPSQGDGTES